MELFWEIMQQIVWFMLIDVNDYERYFFIQISFSCIVKNGFMVIKNLGILMLIMFLFIFINNAD